MTKTYCNWLDDEEWDDIRREEKQEREWRRTIEENAKRVRKGDFGEVESEWLDFDGWFDGVKVPHFKLKNGNIIIANESGVWKKSKLGGWINILEIKN